MSSGTWLIKVVIVFPISGMINATTKKRMSNTAMMDDVMEIPRLILVLFNLFILFNCFSIMFTGTFKIKAITSPSKNGDNMVRMLLKIFHTTSKCSKDINRIIPNEININPFVSSLFILFFIITEELEENKFSHYFNKTTRNIDMI